MMIRASLEHWSYKRPFRIAGYTFDGSDLLVATVEQDHDRGQAEAGGVFYRGETAASMAAVINELATDRADITREQLQQLLPAGGARSALDCALWDLEAKQKRTPVWRLAGLSSLRPLRTTFTLGADEPGQMAQLATQYAQARALKLKLVGDGGDADRVAAVRAARPDVWMGVDANQGFTPDSYEALLPTLMAAEVKLVEQPFTVARDADLDGLGSPIPIAADESVQDRADLERVRGRFDVINVKLDKSGGLTEALAMAAEVRKLGLTLMVGCMTGTSLAIAPGWVLGQLCDLVDLDGPIFLKEDRPVRVSYEGGNLICPQAVWGAAEVRG